MLKRKATQRSALSRFHSAYFYLQQPDCVGDKVYIVQHSCCSLARCIDFPAFPAFVFFLEKVPSSSARFSLPAHLEIVNHVIVQLWIRNKRSQICLGARYLTRTRMHVINKGTVFLSCNSWILRDSPQAWIEATTRSAGPINIMINRRVRQEVKIDRERDGKANILDLSAQQPLRWMRGRELLL